MESDSSLGDSRALCFNALSRVTAGAESVRVRSLPCHYTTVSVKELTLILNGHYRIFKAFCKVSCL